MVYYCKLIDEAPGVTVEFPDFPNVLTLGETKDEALFNAGEALNGALASDVSRGFELPASSGPGPGLYPVEVEPHVLIAAELRRLRGNAPQSEIARRLDLSYQAYQRLENPNKGNPTVRTLEKVARAFGKRLQVTLV
jgi:antitoxin HicB